MPNIKPDPEEFARLPYDEQAERMQNAASLSAIPDEQMPGNKWTRHRIKLDLELRALAGQEIYAYRPAHQPEYVIWDNSEHPGADNRYSPRAWALAHGYDVTSEEADDAANNH